MARPTVRLGEVSRRGDTAFTLAPDADERASLAQDLGIPAIRKLRFSGTLHPTGRSDWDLRAELGATVVQDCVITLAPVTTRIDETVIRRYVEGLAPPGPGEIEMPDDDTVEALPATLDLRLVMAEALALALPHWPRAEGATLEADIGAPPGVAPLTEDELRPFAGLKAALERLGGTGEDDAADGAKDGAEDGADDDPH
ncbi:MAG: DUF177 domain-containing protein [Rubellimicrobium sp.]|nr:DUF177 domain-containing protein [Rubellimicrobium sp.]